MEYTVFKIEHVQYVAKVMLNRPDKRNAMGPAFWPELLAIFHELDKDPEVRAVVLAGNGKHFCAGLDLVESIAHFPKGDGNTFELFTLHNFITEIQESINAVEECNKPVIAAIHGACIGGGLDLVAACDVRLACSDAKFSLREAKVGMVADLGSLQRLPGIIGQGHTRELAFTARDIDADHAYIIGLVNAVFQDRNALMEAAMTMAASIAHNAPLGVQSAKQVLNYCRDKSIRDGLNYVAARNSQILRSTDVVEAFSAFMQKRKPEFKGK